MTTLFDAQEHAHARRTDPLSSHLAAERATERLTDVQERVLILLRVKGAATDNTIIQRFRDTWPELRMSDQSIRSRRADLVRKGLVTHTGDFGTSPYGQPARIWKAVTTDA